MLRIPERIAAALALSGLLALSGPGFAQTQAETGPQVLAEALPELAGPVVLTIAGLDVAHFEGGAVQLDLGRLAFLGQDEIATSSIWTKGIHRYTGVMVADLMRALGIAGEGLRLEFRALNDYRVDFAIDEVTDEAPLLAYLVDGEPMPVRDKGPVWLIYPFDAGAEYRTDTVYSRSIWQLDRIEVLR